ncbi:MAG: DUF349 domain-containing protein [Pseudomonadota bacterium]
MFSWIFKKKKIAPPAVTAAAALATAQAAANAEAAAKQAQQAAAAVWSDRVSRAQGDDTALLALAKEAPSVDIKLAAVRALTQEASLKLAEREFRTHDRRVHQVAKQRHAEVKSQRETLERATGLLQAATALLKESVIPVNRLVELDRNWQSLDAALLSPALQAEFATLSAQLTATVQAHSEHKAAVQRWSSLAQQTITQLNADCLGVATEHQPPEALPPSRNAAQQLLDTMPDDARLAALSTALQSALTKATQLEERLAFLAQLQQVPPATEVGADSDAAILTDETVRLESATHEALDEAALTPPAPPAAPSPTAVARWQALPSIADAELTRALNDRFEAWQRAQAPRPAPRADKRAPAREKPQRVNPDNRAAVEALLSQAEAALAEGQVAQAHQHLMALEHLGEVDATQRTRLSLVQAEVARMKGWQQWGGGLVRDDLVIDAEALARTTAAATEAGEPILQIKAHADAINELRLRWKELDRLKAATSQPLWERFDTALKLAFAPVAAHLEQLEAERQTNLAARHALLDTLDAAPLVEAIPPTDTAAEHAPWKDVIRALDQFQTAWRKLGPVEHTTPRKAQKALLERMTASLARLESPLQDARRVAQTKREALVARAKALNPDARGGEMVAQVRELQAQWQQHARTLPLARAIETTLWADFKAATDAVFAQREAAFSARDAVFKENEVALLVLIERLEGLHADAPVADIKRALAEVDVAWRQIGETTRVNGAALDARFRKARADAQDLVTGYAQRQWHTTCDTLLDKLTLCEAQEAHSETDVDTRWSALPALPPLWERALTQRKTAASASPPSTDDKAADTALLQLEALLDLPSPAEHQAARRDLKLRAMKAALEGGQKSGGPQANLDQLTADVLATQHLSAEQRQRLHQLIAGLRAGAPRS